MAKEKEGKIPDDMVINLDVDIKRHSISSQDLQDFMDNKQEKESLVEYVQRTSYAGQDVVVVPDLSNGTFEIPDLKGVDFTGCNLSNATFQNTHLDGAIFSDADLSGVDFSGCTMTGTDMRGADLSGCRFIQYGKKLTPDEINTNFKGMKFSSTEDLMSRYLKKNPLIRKAQLKEFNDVKDQKLIEQEKRLVKPNEELTAQQKLIDEKEADIRAKQAEINTVYNELYSTLSGFQVIWANAGTTIDNEQYDKLLMERKALEAEKKALEVGKKDLEKEIADLNLDIDKQKKIINGQVLPESDIKYIVHPSLVEIMRAKHNFDHGYVMGSDKADREQEKQYVPLTREDVEDYLEKLKKNPELTINEFAKGMLKPEAVKVGAKIVADLSSRTLESGEFEQIDLSGLDFTGAKLQEACFSGADLTKSTFKDANLSRAIFEGAKLNGAEFENTEAHDANFFCAELKSAKIGENCDFIRAFMKNSNAVDAKINGANFEFADIRNANLKGVKIDDSKFNYANMGGISLDHAKLTRVSMQHAMLDKAIMKKAELIGCNLKEAMMARVDAAKINIQNSVLDRIEAKAIDLTGAKLDKFCSLQGADLEKAILNDLLGEGVNFEGANMNQAIAESAKLEGANLEDVKARFATLKGALIDGAKASGIDLTGANLEKIKAQKAELKHAILEGVKAREADFTGAFMEDANLRGANLTKAIMNEVDLRRADLTKVQAPGVDLGEADVNGAKVDDGSNFPDANVEGAKGEFEHHSIGGEVVNIAPDQQVAHDNRREAEKQKSRAEVAIGNAAGSAASGFSWTTGAITRLNDRFGKKIAMVAGAVVIGTAMAFVGSALATFAVITFPASLGVIAGAAIIGGVVGAVTGNYGAKAITNILTYITQKSALHLQNFCENHGRSPEMQRDLDAQVQANAEYKPPRLQDEPRDRNNNRSAVLLNNRVLAQQGRLKEDGIELPVKAKAEKTVEEQAKGLFAEAGMQKHSGNRAAAPVVSSKDQPAALRGKG